MSTDELPPLRPLSDLGPWATKIMELCTSEEYIILQAWARDYALAARADLVELCDRLKLEAQTHAQEARTANATIAEIYQAVSNGTGEPGNWHGAEPVKAALAQRDERIRELEEQVAGAGSVIETLNADCLLHHQRAEAAEARVKELEADKKYISDCYAATCEARDAYQSERDAMRAQIEALATAAIAYDEAIKVCVNNPDKMASYCTAQGDTLDTLYLNWMCKARAVELIERPELPTRKAFHCERCDLEFATFNESMSHARQRHPDYLPELRVGY